MSELLYFLSENHVYRPDVSLSTPDTEVLSVDYAADELRRTWFECPDSPARLDIDLGASYTIDRLWLHTNGGSVALYYGAVSPASNPLVLTEILNETDGSDQFAFYSFTQQTARYWRMAFTPSAGNARIHETLLMQHLLSLDEDTVPGRVQRTKRDVGGGQFHLADGSLVSYSGPAEAGRWSIELVFDKFPATQRDALLAIWGGLHESTPRQRPAITLYPEPTIYPGDIHQVGWDGLEFPLPYDQSMTLAGYSGSVRFLER